MESTLKNKRIICFVAGKSGGHIIPCLTLAQQYMQTDNATSTLFISTDTPLDMQLLTQNKLVDTHVSLHLPHHHSFIRIPLTIILLLYSFFLSFHYLYRYKPYKIISTGGIIALPVCYAAKILSIPFELYELNAVPGKAITHLAPWAHTIFVCFERTKQYFSSCHCIKIEYPIRFGVINQSSSESRTRLGLDTNKTTILILGGSQGSAFLNKIVTQWLDIDNTWWPFLQIIHQTGSHDQNNWAHWYAQRSIKAVVFSYHHDIAHAYNAADLIVCRAGAGTVFESKFFNKPCIVIPLELVSTSHQKDNACALGSEYPHLFTVLRQTEIANNNVIFYKTIRNLLNLL